MLHPKRYHYQQTISFPISNVTMNQKPQNHTSSSYHSLIGNNMSENKNINNNYQHNHVHHDHNVEDESGMCSPPLWKQKSNNYYRNLSPESKTQAIERGQRELMEMVKNMPESSYELTLKDLVQEKHHNHVEENRVMNKEHHRNKLMSNKNSGKRSNIDSGGFYLKMVFPISLGSKKQYSNKKMKKKSVDSEYGGDQSDHGSMKRSGSSSTSSCSSRRSNSSGRHEVSSSSCWPFIRRSEILSHK